MNTCNVPKLGDASPEISTFSIAAVDPETGEAGVAVASKFLAVGSIVPWMAADTGALATQALANASYGRNGLQLLGKGMSGPDVVAGLIAEDELPERRQLGLVDAKGRAAAHTGSGCQPWAGHHVGPGFACQGNMLVGPQTVEAMADAYERSTGTMADRLLEALTAGDSTGGDRRGRQSAALKVVRAGGGYLGLSDTTIDLRVDDAPDPVGELRRLADLHALYFATGRPVEMFQIEGDLLGELTEMARAAGHLPPQGELDAATALRAIDVLIGTENLENRADVTARTIDATALTHLRTLQSQRIR